MTLKRNRSKVSRNLWIKVRVNEEELQSIQRIAEQKGLAVGNLIRESILGDLVHSDKNEIDNEKQLDTSIG